MGDKLHVSRWVATKQPIVVSLLSLHEGEGAVEAVAVVVHVLFLSSLVVGGFESAVVLNKQTLCYLKIKVLPRLKAAS